MRNEICIVFATYHLFCFTDYVGDPYYRYLMGWSLIALILIILLMNILLIVGHQVNEVRSIFRRARTKQLHKKNQRLHEENRKLRVQNVMRHRFNKTEKEIDEEK